MKYRIELQRFPDRHANTHVVTVKGKIVFRGSDAECHDWVQGCLLAEREFAMEGRS